MQNIIALLLITADPAGAVRGLLKGSEAPRVSTIQIQEPLPPRQWRRTVSGKCGPTHYEAELREGPSDQSAPKLTLRVNGKSVAAAEVEKILEQVPKDLFIVSINLVECTPKSDSLLGWLQIDGPSNRQQIRGVEFRLSPARRISGVR